MTDLHIDDERLAAEPLAGRPWWRTCLDAWRDIVTVTTPIVLILAFVFGVGGDWRASHDADAALARQLAELQQRFEAHVTWSLAQRAELNAGYASKENLDAVERRLQERIGELIVREQRTANQIEQFRRDVEETLRDLLRGLPRLRSPPASAPRASTKDGH